jgi:hypothetical protein
MSNKQIGRNDPCPCGSGKKYKKCCYDKDMEAERQFQSTGSGLNTGTMMDRYMDLIKALIIYMQKILQFDADGKELQEAMDDFEDTFKPGKIDGVPDSVFTSWLMLDFRFGKSKKTVCERLIESAKKDLKETMTTDFERGLEILSRSYFTFYKVMEDSEDFAVFIELYNGKQWKIIKIDESAYESYKPGKVLFTRLFGTQEEAFVAATPLPFSEKSGDRFKTVITGIVERYAKENNVDLNEAHIGSAKHYFRDLLHTLIKGISGVDSNMPLLVNTDGHEVVFETLVYDIKDEKAFLARIVNMKQVEYDDKSKNWTWYKRGQGVMGSRTILGNMKVKGNELLCEVNSGDRAIALMGKIERELKSAVKFRESRRKTMQDAMKEHKKNPKIPTKKQLTPEQQAELNAYMEKYLKEYYLTDWINHTIPALDGLRPLDAIKTEKGKKKLIDLIDQMESMELNKGDNNKFDFNILRKKLKLI